LIEEHDCKAICEQIAGHYYSHRLSRIPGKIIRSHYEFQRFSPFDRLPHVVNRLHYGATSNRDALERTAEGQIIRIGETYVLMAFVYRANFSDAQKSKEQAVKFDGIQINLFPAGQMGRSPPAVIDGIFLSYVYNQSYEIGRMKLVRKSRVGDKSHDDYNFDPTQVGEFTIDEMERIEPKLELSSLKLDVSSLLESARGLRPAEPAVLAACLSFMLAPEYLKLNLPTDSQQ